MYFRSRFAPQIDNDDYRREVFAKIDELLAGKINIATARWHLMAKLKNLGYVPKKGFPAAFEKNWREKLERRSAIGCDLSSEEVIDLMLETEVSLACNERLWVEGNRDFASYAYPAWEMVPIGRREPSIDCADTRPGEWERRWEAAGQSVKWRYALRARMVARKESPIWAALGAGTGGFVDALGFAFPPFALNSAMGWQSVPRSECVSLRLIADPIDKGSGDPGADLDKVIENMSSEQWERLKRHLSQ